MIDDPHDIVRTVRQLRLDLNELKNAQRVGYDSLLTYKTASVAAYDLIASLAAGRSKDFLITLNHAEAKGGALVDLNAYYRVNNPNVMANPVARNVQSNDVSWIKVASNATSTIWRLRIYNAAVSSYTAYVKLFLDGTDTGNSAIQAL